MGYGVFGFEGGRRGLVGWLVGRGWDRIGWEMGWCIDGGGLGGWVWWGGKGMGMGMGKGKG